MLANEETARLIKMSKGQVYAYQVDLTKREEIYRVAERVKQEVGKVRQLTFLSFRIYFLKKSYYHCLGFNLD